MLGNIGLCDACLELCLGAAVYMPSGASHGLRFMIASSPVEDGLRWPRSQEA